MQCPRCGISALVLTHKPTGYWCPFCEHREVAGAPCPHCKDVPMRRSATQQQCPECGFSVPLGWGARSP